MAEERHSHKEWCIINNDQKEIASYIEKMIWFIEDSRPSRHHVFINHIKEYLPLLDSRGWEILKKDLNERQYNNVLRVKNNQEMSW